MDKKQYFKELKNKILESVELVYSKNIDSKITGLKNLEMFISALKRELISKIGEDKYNNKKTITTSDIQKIKKFGEDNGWPGMVLKRESRITKYLGAGEDKWNEILSLATLKNPYNENILDLIRAVEENDKYEPGMDR